MSLDITASGIGPGIFPDMASLILYSNLLFILLFLFYEKQNYRGCLYYLRKIASTNFFNLLPISGQILQCQKGISCISVRCILSFSVIALVRSKHFKKILISCDWNELRAVLWKHLKELKELKGKQNSLSLSQSSSLS